MALVIDFAFAVEPLAAANNVKFLNSQPLAKSGNNSFQFVQKQFPERTASGNLVNVKNQKDKKMNSSSQKNNSLNSNEELATLAGGCFWGVEELIRKQPGVIAVEVGYAGGNLKNATYELVKTGATGHAESVQIKFDKNKTSFENILLFFFKMHDPTTVNAQGNDHGTQYRSAIFYHSEQQKETAQQVIVRVDNSKAWTGKVVTQLVPATEFWKAEDYHQDYLQKHPGGYTCHFVRNIKF
jgi:peptide-methionine (S)-S-oxide reductase